MQTAPMTVEGSSVLHQIFRLRRSAWRTSSADVRRRILDEAVPILEDMAEPGERHSALYSLLGHKGDLLLVHFRRSFQELSEVELRLAGLELTDYLEATTSYLSVVELGLYESSVRLFKGLLERGVQPGSPEWEEQVEEALAQHRKAMAPRLFPSVPEKTYICFYPMDRKRAESANWYRLPMEERRRLMREHGEIGRKYAREVTQIISGSIGFDDWEWGVDLFSDDPVAFKRLIYEMRFDEASALYALFGSFYVGIRLLPQDLGALLGGCS